MSNTVLEAFVESYVLRLLPMLHLKDRDLSSDSICTLSWYREMIQERISQTPGGCVAGKKALILF
ncbi:hypothetical protein LDENG_00221710 [Lucifuga dentata]|nr:hypothetical protein LDENG_00221710 [Lucifuga dentata]